MSNKYAGLIILIESWLADNSGYDEATWPVLRKRLEEDGVLQPEPEPETSTSELSAEERAEYLHDLLRDHDGFEGCKDCREAIRWHLADAVTVERERWERTAKRVIEMAGSTEWIRWSRDPEDLVADIVAAIGASDE